MATKKPAKSTKQAHPELLAMAERLERIRVERRFNKDEFEKLAGLPTGAMSRWPESERLAGIRAVTILHAAKRLNVDAAVLLFGAPLAVEANNDLPAGATEAPGSEVRETKTG